MATKKYVCKVCGYVHTGESAPDVCPVCQQPASAFEAVKTGFSKESNAYIFVYTTIIIVVVSLLLSITSSLLKERQAANVELDKKRQILSTLNLDLKSASVAEVYKTNIEKFVALNADGEEIKDLSDDFNYEFKEGEFPLYIANVSGEKKFIIPLDGAGLWGAIWGYVALNEDKNTIFGVYFSHAGETPGLGANITTEAFQKQFLGKHILSATGDFVSLAVMKSGQIAAGQEQVDAISGGTITSKGVEAMLQNSLSCYEKFFKLTEKVEGETNNEIE